MGQEDQDALTDDARARRVPSALEIVPRASLDRLTRLAKRLLGSPSVFVTVVSADEQIDVRVAEGRSMPEEGAAQVAAKRLGACAMSGREPVYAGTGEEAPDVDVAEALTQLGVSAYAAVPIHDAGGDLAGALCVLETAARTWSSDDRQAMADLAALTENELQLGTAAGQSARAATVAERDHLFLDALLESLDVGVSAVDDEGRVVVMNRKLREYYGRSEPGETVEEWMSRHRDIALLDEDGRTVLSPSQTPLGRAMRGERVEAVEYVVEQPGVAPRRMVANAQAIRRSDGEVLGVVATSYDVTARRKTERMTSLLNQVALARAGGSRTGEHDFIGEIADLVTEGVSWVESALFWADVQLAEDTDPGGWRGDEARRCLREGRTLWTERAVTIPVRSGSAVLGVLSLVGQPGSPDPETQATLEAVAAQLALYLERQRAQRLASALATERESFYRAISAVSDYVWTIEFTGEGTFDLSYESPNVAGMLGGALPEGASVGEVVDQMIHPADRERNAEFQRRLAEGEAGEVEIRVTGFDGRQRWLWLRGRARREGDRLFVDGVTTDVTERHQIAEEREALLRRERDLNRAQSEFTAAAGHELRTPLTVIQGYSNLLAGSEAVDDEAREWAAAIARRCLDLRHLLDDFVDLTKLDAGVALREQVEVDLVRLVDEVTEDHAPAAATAKVSITAELQRPLVVRGDPDRIRQAVDNLVSNAVKYSRQGGHITLAGHSRGDVVRLAVRDDGIGVPEADLPYLFDRFFRATNARELAADGTGLGLAVTDEIARAHDGGIEARLNDGAGMTLILTLPVGGRSAPTKGSVGGQRDRPAEPSSSSPGAQHDVRDGIRL